MSSKYSSSERSHQAILERLYADDMLPAREYDPTDSNLVHVADGFADHRECIMADLAVRHAIVRSDQVSRIDIGLLSRALGSPGVPKAFGVGCHSYFPARP